jgi:hypothetical protein
VYRVWNCRRILQAAEKGHTESYIVCPAAVVGPPSGPVRAGSVFFKFMSQLALAFKKTFYIGEGENIFYTVGIPLPSYDDAFTVPLTRLVALGPSGRPRRPL